MNWLPHAWYWIEIHAGIARGGPDPYYNFWSGFGSDIAEVAILGGVIQMYRKVNCHVHHCWRISRHPIPGSPYVCCKKHHPEVPNKAKGITQEVIEEACRASAVIHEHPIQEPATPLTPE